MHKLVAVALSVPLIGCVAGAPDGDSAEEDPGAGGSTPERITENTTWSGTVDVARQITVVRGATLTIAAGTTVRFASGTSIVVQGTVDVQGSKPSLVQLSPRNTGGHHGGFSVPSGGELRMTYGVQVGGGINVSGGRITVSDSLMSNATGDFLVVGAGTVDVSYSAIGLEVGAGTDSTHCDLHFGGNATTIKVTHTNISTSPYGLMLYGGSGVDLTYNNWFGNGIDVETMPGVMGDVSHGWLADGPPVPSGGATLVASNLAASRLSDAGPR